MPTSTQCLSPEALQRLAAGLLAPAEAARFQQHVDRCERCREALDSLGAQPSVVMNSTAALKTEQAGSSDAIDLGTLSLNKATKLENLKSLGPYRIVRMLGKGGMGAVFEAEDPRLKRCVALKVMLPTLAVDPISRQRFLREAEAMGALEHDNIVSVYMADEDQGIPFLAMPLLKGETLADRIHRDKGPLPLSEVLRIAREVALACPRPMP